MALLVAAAFLVVLGASPPSSSADGNHFFPGYCTWDAAEQAYGASGVWLPWYGDAGDWIDGARASGWPRFGATTVTVRSMDWSGRGAVTIHVLRADGDAQFLTPPD